MKVPAAHLLQQFVDRIREVTGFEQLLNGSTERIMCISGPEGIGKSLLVSRMMKACEQRSLRWVGLEWEDSRGYNYLDVMRRVRDTTDPLLFQLFTDRVNFYTVPEYNLQIPLTGGAIQNVQVLSGSDVQQSGVTVHVGHTLEIHDLMVNIPCPDRRDVTEGQVLTELTEVFMLCLRALTSEQLLVVFLDAVEKADTHTRAWMWDQLLARVRDQELSNVLVVLAGREPFEIAPSYFDSVAEYELQPFQIEDIHAYLGKRGLGRRADDFVEFILATSRGNPLQMAMDINAYIRLQRQRDHEATWANVENALHAATPTLSLIVENKLMSDGSQLPVTLQFVRADDFELARLCDQVEPLRKLRQVRWALAQLLTVLDANDEADPLLQDVVAANTTPIDIPTKPSAERPESAGPSGSQPDRTHVSHGEARAVGLEAQEVPNAITGGA